MWSNPSIHTARHRGLTVSYQPNLTERQAAGPARRRGLARALAVALADEAGGRGVEHLWLQVLADNTAAHALYSRLGFRPASRYAYWTAPSG